MLGKTDGRSSGMDESAGQRNSATRTRAQEAIADVLMWPVALLAATSFYELPIDRSSFRIAVVTAMFVHFAVGAGIGLYRGRMRRFSFDEAGAVAISAGSAGALAIAIEHVLVNDARTGQLIILSTSLAVCLMFGVRYLQRRISLHLAADAIKHRTPVIVYGAGEGGYRVISGMQSVQSSPYRPVALIDDDPTLRHRRIGGLRVEGTRTALARVAERHGARAVVLAMPAATGAELRTLHEVVKAAGLETLVMPPVQRLVGQGSPREITRYADEDVLNRRIVDIDPCAVRELVSGARVLVTGAGGSIGSELIRQLAALEPAHLVALDRDDSLLHDVIASLPDTLRPNCTAVLADIRDEDRIDEVFAKYRPQLVFHAAALKHVPALEGAVSEGWKTNVLGTLNVVHASERHHVGRMVNISTDKAANPVNVLGLTKRIAERVTAAAAQRTGKPYVSVRFGNVIGSRGSALETFERQIAAGGPVTVTHPDVTRYFMAVREAVRLTMQASAIGRGGEALVLDMGTPVKVADVARQLVERSGEDIEIVFTGLRPGEKMHEQLLGSGELAHRPLHPMIDHVAVPPIDLIAGLDQCAQLGSSPLTVEGLEIISHSPAQQQSDTVETPQVSGHAPTTSRRTP